MKYFSVFILYIYLFIYFPGFGQERFNFHQKPGAGTARLADPDWPNKWDIRYYVPSRWVGVGELARGSGVHWGLGSESCSVQFCDLFCIFSLSVPLLLLLASFSILSNLPYPDPRVFAFFFPFSSPPQWG